MSEGQTVENDAPAKVRELTVGQLIERLREYPEHHYVSPMVDGILGAGIDIWQMFDPQTHDTLVVFGESKQPTPPIVPPNWARDSASAGKPVCNWSRCVKGKRADGKCFAWCKCRCHTRDIPSGECCCECSPPEFGGNMPDRECPLHGERPTPPGVS